MSDTNETPAGDIDSTVWPPDGPAAVREEADSIMDEGIRREDGAVTEEEGVEDGSIIDIDATEAPVPLTLADPDAH